MKHLAAPVAATIALVLASPVWAGLKEKPPEGVTLAGAWQLDPYRSDDPQAAIENARSEMRQSGGMRSGGGRRHGGMGGGFPGGGGGFPGGGGSGGMPGGGGGGGWGGHRHGGGAGGADRNGTGDTSTDSNGETHRGSLLSTLAANPTRLAFATNERTLKITADDSNTECAAGVKVAISDSAGNAERNCGWDGRAWVIETTRGKDFKRTDRYELAKDGKTLTYTTTASGGRLPKIKITRLYALAEAPAATPSP